MFKKGDIILFDKATDFEVDYNQRYIVIDDKPGHTTMVITTYNKKSPVTNSHKSFFILDVITTRQLKIKNILDRNKNV